MNFFGNPFASTTSNNEIKKGDLPDIVSKDVIDKLQELTQTISTYKKDNTKLLVDDILKYDKNTSADKQIKLPDNIIKKIMIYHNQILKDLNNDKRPKDAIKEYHDNYMSEFEQKISQNDDYKDNPEVKKGLTDVIKNIKSIKTNSSFFEYKYVQMNIFMVYFVQKVYNLLEKYTDDVTKYMILQNAYRQKLMIDFMQQIIKVLQTDKNVSFNEDEQKQFTNMIDRISAGFENTEKKVKADLEKMKTGVVNDFANEILKSDTKSTMTNNKSNASTMTGGMLRDLSILPQKFYEMLK